MTGYQYPAEGNRRRRAALLVGSLLALSTAVGLAYSLGVLDKQKVVESAVRSQVTVSSDRLDFGAVPLKNSVVRQLVVRNKGTEPLEAAVSVKGSRYHVKPERLILHPGVDSRIAVELTADAAGELTDELQIAIDKAGTVVVALAGQGTDGSVTAQVGASVAAQPTAAEGASFTGSGAGPGRAGSWAGTEVQNGSVTAATAGPSVSGAGANAAVTGAVVATIETPPGQEIAEDNAARDAAARGQIVGGLDREGMGVTVRPYDPANAVPYRSLAEKPAAASEGITSEEQNGARPLPSKIPGAEQGLPETLPDGPTQGDKKHAKPGEGDALTRPTLTVSGQSTVRIMGSFATFYPQRMGVMGSDMGGRLGLAQTFQFPTVPLAFGESMLFAQLGPAAGQFDAMTGEVHLELPIQAVDSDGDAAPMTLHLTTGAASARNESGVVVTMSGSARKGDGGVLRLVGIEKIPAGYRNGGEERLAVFEILASLSFGNSTTGPSSPGKTSFGRIGG